MTRWGVAMWLVVRIFRERMRASRSTPSRTTSGNIRSDEKQCAVKAFIFERNGEPTDVLGIRDLPDPVPGPGEGLVRIRLSPIHSADLHVLRGRFGRPPTPPTSPGVGSLRVVDAPGPG